MNDVALIVPTTSSISWGFVVPIPTKPFDDTRTRSVPAVLKARLLAIG